MEMEIETLSLTESLVDSMLEMCDIKRMETTEHFVNIHVQTYYGPVIIKRNIETDAVSFEAK